MRRYIICLALACQVIVAMAAGAGWTQSAESIIVGWGLNNRGQCNAPPPNQGFIAVAGGRDHSLGLRSDGSIVAWGENIFGQCNVPLPNEDFIGIAGKYWYSFGLKSNGTIVATRNGEVVEDQETVSMVLQEQLEARLEQLGRWALLVE